MAFGIKNLIDVNVNKLIEDKAVIVGLDIGDRTIGIAVSDRRIKIASVLSVINRKNIHHDCDSLINNIKIYNPGLIIFGWPVQMNGIPSMQCEKVLEFVQELSKYIAADFAKWDERFSTSVVENIMIEADLSRRRRKQVIDKAAAVYILQGAVDFLNKSNNLLIKQFR